MGIVELVSDKSTRAAGGYLDDIGTKLTQAFLDRGVLLRPLGNVLSILASGKGSRLAQYTPDELMHSGNGELVNWVITAGICGDVKVRVLDYIRLWHIGLGYLYWEV